MVALHTPRVKRVAKSERWRDVGQKQEDCSNEGMAALLDLDLGDTFFCTWKNELKVVCMMMDKDRERESYDGTSSIDVGTQRFPKMG